MKIFLLIGSFCIIIFTNSCELFAPPELSIILLDEISIAPWLNDAEYAVSFTWDDTQGSHGPLGNLFEYFGYRTSFFVNPGFKNYQTSAHYIDLALRGHEIGNHTMNHLDLRTLAPDELDFQIRQAKTVLEHDLKIPIRSFVHPFNATCEKVNSVVFEYHRYSRIASTTGIERRNIVNLYSNTTFEQILADINHSRENAYWLIFAGHSIDGNGWEPVDSFLVRKILEKTSNRILGNVWLDRFDSIAFYELLYNEVWIESIAFDRSHANIYINGFEQESYSDYNEALITIRIPISGQISEYIHSNTVYSMDNVENPIISITIDLKTTKNLVLSVNGKSLFIHETPIEDF